MAPSILSVSELTQQIKQELEILFPKIQVKGEISNFKHHSSGHIYMTLKDEGRKSLQLYGNMRRPGLPADRQME